MTETIEDYFKEWEQNITELSEKEVEQTNIKKTYAKLEFEILTTFNFKDTYGKDNDKVRNHHIKTELKELADKKTELEISINYLKRRIEFIKELKNTLSTYVPVVAALLIY